MRNKPVINCFEDEVGDVANQYWEGGLSISEMIEALERVKVSLAKEIPAKDEEEKRDG